MIDGSTCDISTMDWLSIHELIRAAALANPTAIALKGDDGSYTFAQMDSASDRLALTLMHVAAGSPRRIGIFLPRSCKSVIAVLGVLKAGAAYVPLDPQHPQERLDYIVADASVSSVIVDDSTRGVFKNLREVDVDESPSFLEGTPVHRRATHPDDAAYLVYTSGSTGKPQGVVGLHRGIVNRNLDLQARYPLGQGDIGSHKTSLNYFDSGGEIFWPLMCGVPVVVFSDALVRDVESFVRALETDQVTRLVAVPALLRSIIESVPDVGARLSALRFVHSSGEQLPERLAEELQRALPQATFINLYGSSEISADVTLHELSQASSVTLGRPMRGVTVHVLDQDLRQLPPGEVGQIFVGGEALARGYHRRPALTADRFLPNPHGQPGARMFRTGDLGHWSTSGELVFNGRADHQVKIRGHRIELGEIEHHLLNHPAVADAVVVSEHDDDGGSLTAFVVERSQPTGSSERLRAWHELYDRMYASLDTDRREQETAWTDSYTGRPFPADVMDAWIDSSLRVIEPLEPSSLLEVGCGTGNLLLRLAEGRRYVGTDFSDPVLEHVRLATSSSGSRLDHVDLVQAPADDLSVLGDESFDVVVLNSVVQYFPDEQYLRRSMESALARLKPGGHLFVGDVRDLSVLSAFYRHRAEAAGIDDVTSAVQVAAASEQELVVDRAFFYEVAANHGIPCRVLVKGMPMHNELSRFRYDVVLGPLNPVNVGPRGRGILEWHPADLDELRQVLQDHPHLPVAVENVPNARLQGLLSEVGRGIAFDPEEVRSLAASLDRHVDVLVSSSTNSGGLELRFEASGLPSGSAVWKTHRPARPERLANFTADEGASADELRRHLSTWLPRVMVPRIVLTGCLPRTVHGKVDRRELLGQLSQAVEQVAVAPKDASDWASHVADAWKQVLGVSEVPFDANFFDAGGNSLSLVRLHIRLKQLCGKDFPLIDLYENVTVEQQISYLEMVSMARADAEGWSVTETRAAKPISEAYVETARTQEMESE